MIFIKLMGPVKCDDSLNWSNLYLIGNNLIIRSTSVHTNQTCKVFE